MMVNVIFFKNVTNHAFFALKLTLQCQISVERGTKKLITLHCHFFYYLYLAIFKLSLKSCIMWIEG